MTAGRMAPAAKGRPRVMIVGAGVAGASVALALRRLAPAAEVVLIERAEAFVSRPSTFDYLLGQASWANITRAYDGLTGHGVRLIRAEVEAIEPARQRLLTRAGTHEYDVLVVATGIRLASEAIVGLEQNPEINASLYDPRQLALLRKRLHAYQGGTILVSIPLPPHQCPPAPYEFVLLLSEYIRRRKLKGRIVLLDANTSPQPMPLAQAFELVLERNRDLIEYIPAIEVERVDAAARRVMTTYGEAFSYDLLSLIPPQRAAHFVKQAGLSEPGDAFVAIDPLSFRSTKFDTIYALGDVARTPFARTAASANACALVCAREIAVALGAQTAREVTPLLSFQGACYPYVNREEALLMRIHYELKRTAEGPQVETRVTVDEQPRAAHAAERKTWERALLRQVFGT